MARQISTEIPGVSDFVFDLYNTSGAVERASNLPPADAALATANIQPSFSAPEKPYDATDMPTRQDLHTALGIVMTQHVLPAREGPLAAMGARARQHARAWEYLGIDVSTATDGPLTLSPAQTQKLLAGLAPHLDPLIISLGTRADYTNELGGAAAAVTEIDGILFNTPVPKHNLRHIWMRYTPKGRAVDQMLKRVIFSEGHPPRGEE